MNATISDPLLPESTRVSPARSTTAGRPWIGPLFASLGALGFSGKAIFIKLAYAASNVDALTLLALRMLFSLPLFLLLGWWSTRRQAHVALSRFLGVGIYLGRP